MKARWIFGLIITVLVSCKKDPIEIQDLPESNDPVFRVTGTIDNEPVSLEAGLGGAKIEFAQQYRNNVLFSLAQMVKGTEKYRIGVFDGNTELPPLSSFLQNGDTLFLADRFSTPLAVLSRSNHSNADKITSIKWYVDGEYKATNEYNILEPGEYEVCGEYEFFNGYKETVCNTLKVGFLNKMKVEMRHFMVSPYKAQLWLSGEDTLNIANVKWYSGDTLLGEGLSTYGDVWYYSKVRAEITSVDNKKYVHEILVNGTNLGCYSEDFNAFVTPVTKTWDYAVAVEIEKNGESFSTLNSDNFKSKLFVDKMEVYEVRANGDVVYKIEGRIDAKLSNANQSKSFFIHLNYVYPLLLEN